MALVWTSPSEDRRTFIAEIAGVFESNLSSKVFVEAWRFFLKEIVPMNRRSDWNHIHCEFWLDSGRCILFVDHCEMIGRIDRSCCQILSPDLSAIWAKCARIEGENDFERAVGEEITKLIAAALGGLVVAVRDSDGLHGVEVEFWDADSKVLKTHFIE